MIREKIKFITITLLLLLTALGSASATTVGTGRGEMTKEGDLRIIFPVSDQVTFNSFTLQNPARLVIDIPNAQLQNRVTTLPISGNQVQRVRLGTQQGTDLRIVVDMNTLMPANTALVKVRSGYELVIVISGDKRSRAQSDYTADRTQTRVITESRNVQTAKMVPKKDVLIVIDPGHGGKDPGALGSGGTREKDVVLQISRILRDKINKERGMRAILTRDKDIFIPLRERVLIARRNKADMFISVHADAGSKTADGASVYILSTSGASSEAARMLARAENRSDLIGGVKISDKDDAIASMLLDISQDATIEASNALGKHLLTNLRRHANLHKRNVERAGFAVLKAPDIPSVLVETGFISNPNEERKLKNRAHQNQLAEDILLGIKAYYKERPAMELVYQTQKVKHQREVTETVRQAVAPPVEPIQKSPVVTTPPPPVTVPKEAGAPVRFPELELRSTAETTPPPAVTTPPPISRPEVSAVKRYRTERGDTMESIARKFGVNEQRLKERNGLPSNQLRVPVGTELVIP